MLKTHLGIPEKDLESQKRKSVAKNESVNKKIKMEKSFEKLDDYVMPIKIEKPKVPSAKEKAWGRAASGTKSISSFFKAK